jgi:hypothetical protein
MRSYAKLITHLPLCFRLGRAIPGAKSIASVLNVRSVSDTRLWRRPGTPFPSERLVGFQTICDISEVSLAPQRYHDESLAGCRLITPDGKQLTPTHSVLDPRFFRLNQSLTMQSAVMLPGMSEVFVRHDKEQLILREPDDPEQALGERLLAFGQEWGGHSFSRSRFAARSPPPRWRFPIPSLCAISVMP